MIGESPAREQLLSGLLLARRDPRRPDGHGLGRCAGGCDRLGAGRHAGGSRCRPCQPQAPPDPVAHRLDPPAVVRPERYWRPAVPCPALPGTARGPALRSLPAYSPRSSRRGSSCPPAWLQLLVSAIDRTESGLPSAFPDRFWNAIRHLSNDEWYEGIQLVSSYCRVFFLSAAIVWEPVATLEDPDVDPVSPKHHLTPSHTDSILPPWCVPNATGVLLCHVLPSQAPHGAQRFAVSLRIPRAPPGEAPPAHPPGCNSLYPPSIAPSQVSLQPFRIVSGTPSMISQMMSGRRASSS